jgi:hypothetical protein
MPNPTPEVRRYIERGLPELEEELAVYREQATGARRGPGDALQDLVPALRERVCAEWKWCDKRQDARFDDPVNIAALLASMLAPDALRWQVPAALVAVILVKRGLDAFCNCPPL